MPTPKKASKKPIAKKPAKLVAKKPTTPKKVPPAEQPKSLASILKQSQESQPTIRHLIVKALAGTGKTTTLIEGLKWMRDPASVSIVPSPQQLAVWDEMRRLENIRSIGFVAFNKSIRDELARRVPPGVKAMTCHGLGFGAVRSGFVIQPGDNGVAERKVDFIVSDLAGEPLPILRKKRPGFVSVVAKLIGLCKVNLVDAHPDILRELARIQDLDIEPTYWSDIDTYCPEILERCKAVSDGRIDYNDMIWLPIVCNLPVYRYDLLLVDEAQDLSPCQQALIQKAARHLILVGDPNQAIYGFAGADSTSIDRMVGKLHKPASGSECIVLPLTVTRRCGRKIVEEARQYVPEFEAHESNSDGEVITAKYPTQVRWINGERELYTIDEKDSYFPLVGPDDMIVCRSNAPLVKECFRFLKTGKRAKIQGRKIGEGLLSLIDLVGLDLQESAPSIHLVNRLGIWETKEIEKENLRDDPSPTKIELITDRVECLNSICLACSSVGAVKQHIANLFTDTEERGVVRLSSIHRGKGLEAHTVFWLRPAAVFSREAKLEWQRRQEDNLCYVAITRAISKLVIVV